MKNWLLIKIFNSIKKDKSVLFCLSVLAFFLFSSLLAPLFLTHSPEQVFEEFLNLPPVWMEGGSWKFPLGNR